MIGGLSFLQLLMVYSYSIKSLVWNSELSLFRNFKRIHSDFKYFFKFFHICDLTSRISIFVPNLVLSPNMPGFFDYLH